MEVDAGVSLVMKKGLVVWMKVIPVVMVMKVLVVISLLE